MSVAHRALVVGGGVGGMSAAICLQKAGLEVELIDADPNWRALGAGVTLNGGALRAFKQVGVLEEIRRQGASGGQTSIYTADGQLIVAAPAESPFGPEVPAVGGIMRPILHKILQQAVTQAGVAVRLGVGLASLEQDDTRVTAHLTDGSKSDYDLLLGADGINSTVRQLIFPNAPRPQFTGQGCWRAVVARPPEVTGPRMYFGSQKCGVNPVSDRQMYLFLLQNISEKRRMSEESWVELLKAEMTEFTAPVMQAVADSLSDRSHINYRPLEALLLPPPWHKQRVLLIGDAAHSTTPHSAYGAGLAVEDGVVLAELLANRPPLGQALEQFMTKRFERCRAVVEGSVKQGLLEQQRASMQEVMKVAMAVASVIQQPI